MALAKLTVAEIARQSGVSTATVDRVLNNRPGVKERTRKLVLAVADQLDVLPETSASAVHDQPSLDFLLPGGTNTFINLLAGYLNDLGTKRKDVRVRVRRLKGFAPEELADAIDELAPDCAGLGVIGLDHPIVREALRRFSTRGKPVLTLVSDISHVNRAGYVGIDNRAAGRLAGLLVGRLLPRIPAKVALFAGTLAYRGHDEREMGFRHVLQENFPHLQIVVHRELREETERAYSEAMAVLADFPDLAAIYNIGSGNQGIARALQEANRSDNIVFIGHELTEHTRRYLLSGLMDAAIDQNPRVEAREAVDRLLQAIKGNEPVSSWTVRIQAVFRENIPNEL